jgi:hypothetical protein
MEVFQELRSQIECMENSHSLNREEDLNDLKHKIMVSFLEIQRLNRSMNNATKRSKVSCLDYKALLDKLHLSIQNLNYESQYIAREIHKCSSQE